MSKANRREIIYEYIVDHININGYAPTIREICQHMDISSTSSVYYHVEALRDEGRLNSVLGKSRSITLKEETLPFVNAPLVGNISAGQGSLAIENIESYYPIPSGLFAGDDLFLLRVQGDSMIDAGISDGNIVIVNKQNRAEIKEIVVVYWDGLATVKRLASLEPLILHPENSTMQDILIEQAEQCMIVGKVVGCLKRY